MGIAAFGTLLKMSNGLSGMAEVFNTIGEVGDIDGPTISVETIDLTNHSSSGARKEFVAGLIDNGEISFSINFEPDDTTHDATAGLQYVANQRTLRNFKIVYPDLSEVTFAALVTNFGIKAPVADKLSADVTLKISGALTWS